MKSKEELFALKEEVETLSKKLLELTEDELKEVVGGHDMPRPSPDEKYILRSNPGVNAFIPIIFAGTNGGKQSTTDTIIKTNENGFSQK